MTEARTERRSHKEKHEVNQGLPMAAPLCYYRKTNGNRLVGVLY